MTANDSRSPMPLFLVIHSVVAGDFLTGFAMMPRSFTGLHVFFSMGGGIAGDVGSADVADGDLYRAVDGNALSPSLFVDDPDALRFLHPGLL